MEALFWVGGWLGMDRQLPIVATPCQLPAFKVKSFTPGKSLEIVQAAVPTDQL